MEILSTTDYSIFKFIASNREVDSAHLRNIAKSIKENNLLAINPIIVNSKMEVVDGQHRLQVAKDLGLEVFYIISDTVKNGDISKLNINRKNWTAPNYLDFYCAEGLEDYRTAAKFINAHNKIPLTAAIRLLSPDYSKLMADFKSGAYKVQCLPEAENIATQLDQLAQYGKFVHSAIFIIFYSTVVLNEKFEFEKLLYQINKSPREFCPCVSSKSYCEMFNEVYNRNTASAKRVLFK